MTRKKRVAFISVFFLVIILLGAKLTYSALNERIFSTIKIAYMNGYVEALQLDVDYITMMKKDEGLLKKTVFEAAESYVVSVRRMNTDEAELRGKKE